MRIDLALAALAMTALAGCACMYGGPGCDEPALVGLCEPRVPLGAEVPVQVAYGDDTGLHPVAWSVVESAAPAVLAVARGGDGAVVLRGVASGAATLRVVAAGWPDVHVFALEVAPGALAPCDGAIVADGPEVAPR